MHRRTFLATSGITLTAAGTTPVVSHEERESETEGSTVGPTDAESDPLGRLRGGTDLSRRLPDEGEWYPEWRGGNVFGLQTVDLDDGSHLVGSLGMIPAIYDFTDQRVVYDFDEFRNDDDHTYLVGSDTYGAAASWNGDYYWGGWTFSNTKDGYEPRTRWAYIVETSDLEEWNVILADRGADHGLEDPTGGYPAEVSDIVAMPSGIYFARGDDGGSGVGLGVYRYDGSEITRITDDRAFHLLGLRDTVVYRDPNREHGLVEIHVADGDRVSRRDLSAEPVADRGRPGEGGTVVVGHVKPFEANSCLFSLCRDHIDVYAPGSAESVRIPYLIHPVQHGEGYGLGEKNRNSYRSRPLSVDGGVVFAQNRMSYNHEDWTEFLTGYLSYFDGQSFRIVATGRWISSLELYGDHVVYGVSPSDHDGDEGHTNGLTSVQNTRPSLGMIPLSELGSASVQPPITDPFEYVPYDPDSPPNDGHCGLIGGIPTLGYDRVRIDLEIDTTATVTVWEWDLWRDAREVTTESFDDERKLLTLDDDLSGGIVGFECDSKAIVRGAINLQ